MLPVEDWEKAGPTQPDTIERTTIRKTRDVFMIGPSVAVRSDPVRTYSLNIKRLRYLGPTKNRRGARCPESADRSRHSSNSWSLEKSSSGPEWHMPSPASKGPLPCRRHCCKPLQCDKAERNATLNAGAIGQGSHGTLQVCRHLRRCC